MGRVKNFDIIIEELKTKLPEYLIEKGYSDPSKINCINPNHEDRNPSMGLVPASNDTVLHCFSCKSSYNIIDAYAILEGTPVEGPGWLMSTFLPLCRKYNINVEFDQLTEEEKYNYSVYRAYEKAAKIVKESDPSMPFLAEVEKRGWNLILVREKFGIGSVKFDDFIEKMIGFGYSKQFLEDVDLYNPKIFHDNGVIIPIREDKGAVCGFVTRNLNCNKSTKSSNKFINTSNRCPIYKKANILFNFNDAKAHIPPLFIFESYLDTITFALKGMPNVVGIGATALTEEHLELLRRYEVDQIILSLDFDAAGQEATAKYVEQLSGRPGLSLKVVAKPDGIDDSIVDPEDYVNKYGLDAYLKLPIIGAFEWKLLNSDYKQDSYDLAINTIPIIANEPSGIERQKLCEILAKHTNIGLAIIQEELDRILNIEVSRKTEGRNDVIRRTIKDLQKYPQDAHTILCKSVDQLEELDVITSNFTFSKDEYIEFLDYKKLAEETTEQLAYKSGFDRFDIKTFSRWAEPGQLIAFGGRPNSGKTAFLVNMAYNIASMNDDTIVLFHTIDDSRFLLVPKFTALISGIRINHIITPEFSKQYWTHKDFNRLRNSAYSTLKELGQANKLIIKDSELGTNIEAVEQWVKKYRKENPNKRIIYFLDNFHLLTDLSNIPDERVRVKTLSRLIKKLVTKYGISLFMTVEYTKIGPGERPHNSNILETGQIEFDCTGIFHVYNPFNDLGSNIDSRMDRDDWVWHEYDELSNETLVKPKIELITGKSKLSAFKGSYFFKFSPELSKFEEEASSAVNNI